VTALEPPLVGPPVPEPEAGTPAGAEPEEEHHVAGWRIVATKELADHVTSIRFVILVAVVALAGLAAIHSASSNIRDAAGQASGTPSLFLYLFTVSPDRVPAFYEFIGFLGPLLGIALGFDAISSERSQRTLPRLVSQPIHRDDVINGKFVAGVAAIALAVGTVLAAVAGYGILRLGLVPTGSDLTRLVVFFLVSVVYISLWLAVAILFSTLSRRSSTTILATIALWLVMTFFAGLLSGTIADALHPTTASSPPEAVLANARVDQNIHRISPDELFEEATQVLLDPAARTTSSIVASNRLDQALPSSLSLDESLSLAWWQVVSMAAAAAVIFVAAYLVFLRQEIRA
jgi:ABC-2 type transport system permease protein